MNWYETINRLYFEKLWQKDRVKEGVEIGVITLEQYKDIVGEDYPKL